MSASELVGSITGSIVVTPVVIAYIIGVSLFVVGLTRVMSYDYPRIPLQRGRRCRKLLWIRGGTVWRRNDYEKSDGSMIEAYDVEWDAYEADPSDAQDGVWRCHIRPEPLLKFYLLRSIGRR